ncbi:MAG TPA: antibiotic biosynthesis monooxygenase [Acetobacteraceae bacterium]
MFAVIFEVEPRAERWDDYLRYAGLLKPELERIDGFIENRRFRSRRHPGRLLSLSLWRDEKSVVRWRSQAMHHGVQAKGRSDVFRDYHLRVGEVIAEDGVTLPQLRFDATQAGAARAIVLVEQPEADTPAPAPALVDWDMFDGVLDPQDRILVLSWRDEAAIDAVPSGHRRRDVRVIRDYGMRDRAEAPQYHAPAPPD